MLIVEDNDQMRAALREFMRAAFPERTIHEAAACAAALAVVREHRPRLVLTDIDLPDANGIALTAAIKALFPEIHVIVVTDFDEASYVQHALSAGAFAYVTKDKIHTDLVPLARRALEAGAPRPPEAKP